VLSEYCSSPVIIESRSVNGIRAKRFSEAYGSGTQQGWVLSIKSLPLFSIPVAVTSLWRRLGGGGTVRVQIRAREIEEFFVISQHVGQLRGRIEGFCALHLKLRDFFCAFVPKT
jgi:hypothetical protein